MIEPSATSTPSACVRFSFDDLIGIVDEWGAAQKENESNA